MILTEEEAKTKWPVTGRLGWRSGLCLAHLKHRSNKRRYSKGWDFHGGN